MTTVERLTETADVLGEGPVWDVAEQALYWVDIESCRVNRLAWSDRAVTRWTLPERVSAVALRRQGGFICALESGIALADPTFSALAWIARPETGLPGNRFN